jgi:hypothetical protein
LLCWLRPQLLPRLPSIAAMPSQQRPKLKPPTSPQRPLRLARPSTRPWDIAPCRRRRRQLRGLRSRRPHQPRAARRSMPRWGIARWRPHRALHQFPSSRRVRVLRNLHRRSRPKQRRPRPAPLSTLLWATALCPPLQRHRRRPRSRLHPHQPRPAPPSMLRWATAPWRRRSQHPRNPRRTRTRGTHCRLHRPK